MKSAYDSTMRWFGKSFHSPMYEGVPEVPTPVGDTCVGCEEKIVDGDIGVTIPWLGHGPDGRASYHIECQIRSVIGDLDHQEGKCVCHGYYGPPTDRGMTSREEAQEVIRRFWGDDWKERP